MHLNKDNLYKQEVEFENIVQVLRENIEDYDIQKVKLVRYHFNPFELIFYNTDPCIIHIICGINLSLQIWIPIIHKNHWVA
jgi:hypothetical protein